MRPKYEIRETNRRPGEYDRKIRSSERMTIYDRGIESMVKIVGKHRSKVFI